LGGGGGGGVGVGGGGGFVFFFLVGGETKKREKKKKGASAAWLRGPFVLRPWSASNWAGKKKRWTLISSPLSPGGGKAVEKEGQRKGKVKKE